MAGNEINNESEGSVLDSIADDSADILLMAATTCDLNGTTRVVKEDARSTCSSKVETKQFCHNLKNNGSYRRKFVLSMASFWSFMTLGWMIIQIGTALPDLQQLIDIDLDSASWLFTTASIGDLTGSLIFGFLYDRCNRLVIMCTCALGSAVCTVCIPYSGSFAVMVMLRTICGIFGGGTNTGVNTIVPSIWGEEGGPYMQALYLSYTVGGIIVPFCTKPFMSPHHKTQHLETIDTDNSITSSLESSYTAITDLDLTNSTGSNETYIFNSSQPVYDSHSVYSTGTIQYAFIITGVLLVVSAVPYILMTLVGGFDQKQDRVNKPELRDQSSESETEELSTHEDNVKRKRSGQISGKRKYFVLFCVCGVNFFYIATEDSFGAFIVTFCIDYLQWDNGSAVTLLSLYWVASCVGGLSGILLLRVLSSQTLLFVAHLCWVCTFLGALLASIYQIDLMIWIFIPSSDLFMVLITPAIISWTQEHVCDVTGCVSATIMVTAGVGIAANPKFIGHMMESYSYIAFIYILFADAVLCFGFYLAAYIGRFSFLPNSSI